MLEDNYYTFLWCSILKKWEIGHDWRKVQMQELSLQKWKGWHLLWMSPPSNLGTYSLVHCKNTRVG